MPIAAELKRRNINGQTWKVLQETIFPNASDASILMAIDYCKVRNLRTTAMRTGQYAGCDDTVFGKDITQKVGDVEITFPEYAQVTVYRMIAGQRVPFSGGKVRWLETVATTKEGSPNSMWKQRPYGQIEKCAEAAALRKAFPEELGNEYAAEEMGNKIDNSRKQEKAEVVDVFEEPKKISKKETPVEAEMVIDAELEAQANEYFEKAEQEC